MAFCWHHGSSAHGQETPAGAASTGPVVEKQASGQTPVLLPGPAAWRFEKIPLPPRFAPDIRLSGFEEVRFAPGMFDTGSPDYFTYVVALSVDGSLVTDAAALKDFLEKYYRGLSEAVGRGKGLAPDVSQINAVISPVRPGEGAGDQYMATVSFLDTFNDGRRVVLNMEIGVTATQAGRQTLITFLISPQPPTAAAWGALRQIKGMISPGGP